MTHVTTEIRAARAQYLDALIDLRRAGCAHRRRATADTLINLYDAEDRADTSSDRLARAHSLGEAARVFQWS